MRRGQRGADLPAPENLIMTTIEIQVPSGTVELYETPDGWFFRRALLSHCGFAVLWCFPVGPFPTAKAAELEASDARAQ